MKAINHLLARYKHWILATLAPLGGIWAIFIIALVDASFFGVPIDLVVISYVISEPHHAFVFAIMGSLGSALGSLVPYLIGYKGGETLVAKKLGKARFERVHGLSEKYGDLALIIPALMPPGFPFKAFVLIAGVTEMGYLHFLLSVFLGRLLRFLIVGGLIIAYGPEILSFMASAFQHHRGATFAVIGLVIAIGYLIVRVRKSRIAATEASLVA